MRPSRSLAIGFGAVLAALGSVLAAPVPAFAEDATTIEFVDAGPTIAEFASPWTLELEVTAAPASRENGYVETKSDSGTVDVYVDGIAGVYASGLPIQADGVAYFAQPATQPLLAAGTHTVRAIFNPLAGSRLLSSQTTVPATLTINPLTVEASVTARMDASVADAPIVTGSLSGGFVDAYGGPPAGIWTFTARDGEGEIVFATAVAQEGLSNDPVQIIIPTKLARDAEFAVEGVYTPDPSLAAGITVTQAPTARFTSAAASFAELLVTPVPAQGWAIVLAGTILLLMIAATSWLAVVLVRRRRKSRSDGKETASPTPDESATDAVDPDGFPDSGLGELVVTSPSTRDPDAPGEEDGSDGARNDGDESEASTSGAEAAGVPTNG
jgi:hypothetical protein